MARAWYTAERVKIKRAWNAGGWRFGVGVCVEDLCCLGEDPRYLGMGRRFVIGCKIEKLLRNGMYISKTPRLSRCQKTPQKRRRVYASEMEPNRGDLSSGRSLPFFYILLVRSSFTPFYPCYLYKLLTSAKTDTNSTENKSCAPVNIQ